MEFNQDNADPGGSTQMAYIKWHTVQIYFVLTFPQTLIEHTFYMEIPKGFELKDGHDQQDYVLKLH
jgi:hypothetical protein